MVEYIKLEENQYPIRDLRLNEYEVDVKVSGESLESVIFDDSDEYTSREAQLLDELIFFYLPDEMVTDSSDAEIEQYIIDNLEW